MSEHMYFTARASGDQTHLMFSLQPLCISSCSALSSLVFCHRAIEILDASDERTNGAKSDTPSSFQSALALFFPRPELLYFLVKHGGIQSRVEVGC